MMNKPQTPNLTKPNISSSTLEETAMQQLKSFISDELGEINESTKISDVWDKIKLLLEVEKIQIKTAFNSGASENEAYWCKEPLLYKESSEEYYIKTY